MYTINKDSVQLLAVDHITVSCALLYSTENFTLMVDKLYIYIYTYNFLDS